MALKSIIYLGSPVAAKSLNAISEAGLAKVCAFKITLLRSSLCCLHKYYTRYESTLQVFFGKLIRINLERDFERWTGCVFSKKHFHSSTRINFSRRTHKRGTITTTRRSLPIIAITPTPCFNINNRRFVAT